MFDAQAITRCHQVFCEVLGVFGDAAAEAYLIGGWAIYYVLHPPDRPAAGLQYAGTLDVDVALVLQASARQEVYRTRFLGQRERDHRERVPTRPRG